MSFTVGICFAVTAAAICIFLYWKPVVKLATMMQKSLELQDAVVLWWQWCKAVFARPLSTTFITSSMKEDPIEEQRECPGCSDLHLCKTTSAAEVEKLKKMYDDLRKGKDNEIKNLRKTVTEIQREKKDLVQKNRKSASRVEDVTNMKDDEIEGLRKEIQNLRKAKDSDQKQMFKKFDKKLENILRMLETSYPRTKGGGNYKQPQSNDTSKNSSSNKRDTSGNDTIVVKIREMDELMKAKAQRDNVLKTNGSLTDTNQELTEKIKLLKKDIKKLTAVNHALGAQRLKHEEQTAQQTNNVHPSQQGTENTISMKMMEATSGAAVKSLLDDKDSFVKRLKLMAAQKNGEYLISPTARMQASAPVGPKNSKEDNKKDSGSVLSRFPKPKEYRKSSSKDNNRNRSPFVPASATRRLSRWALMLHTQRAASSLGTYGINGLTLKKTRSGPMTKSKSALTANTDQRSSRGSNTSIGSNGSRMVCLGVHSSTGNGTDGSSSSKADTPSPAQSNGGFPPLKIINDESDHSLNESTLDLFADRALDPEYHFFSDQEPISTTKSIRPTFDLWNLGGLHAG